MNITQNRIDELNLELTLEITKDDYSDRRKKRLKKASVKSAVKILREFAVCVSVHVINKGRYDG